MDRIMRLANECDVGVQTRAIHVGDLELTVTAVPEIRDRIVTTPDGRLLRRIGGDCQPVRGDAMASFVRERGGHPAEENVVVFVEAHTRRHEEVVGIRRETFSEYPEGALREAILNALAHRDYGLVGSTIDITVWDDRVEIKSPGPLPGHITVENMAHAHFSRNRRIMRVLKTMGLVEEYGEGMRRMRRSMSARLMEPPIVSASSSSVTVTLRNRILGTVEDQVWLAVLDEYDMSELERRALVAAGREGGMTPRRLRELLPEADASQVLAGAVAKGLMVRIGERGGTRYQLSDEIVMRAGSSGLEARMSQRRMLLDEIRHRGSLSTREGVQLLGEPLASVRQTLNELVEHGLARAEGRTRARRYYPPS